MVLPEAALARSACPAWIFSGAEFAPGIETTPESDSGVEVAAGAVDPGWPGRQAVIEEKREALKKNTRMCKRFIGEPFFMPPA